MKEFLTIAVEPTIYDTLKELKVKGHKKNMSEVIKKLMKGNKLC